MMKFSINSVLCIFTLCFVFFTLTACTTYEYSAADDLPVISDDNFIGVGAEIVETGNEGVPDYKVMRDIESWYIYDNPKKPGSIIVSFYEIYHDYDSVTMLDTITTSYVVSSPVSVREYDVSMTYNYNEIWRHNVNYKNLTYIDWDFESLIGTTWRGHGDAGAIRTVRINNVNEETQTIDLDYGYSSCDRNEILSYTIKDDQILTVDLTYDFYNFEIHVDGSIWNMAYMTQLADDYE